MWLQPRRLRSGCWSMHEWRHNKMCSCARAACTWICLPENFWTRFLFLMPQDPLCPSFSAQEGGKLPWISCLLPVSPAIRNKPSVKAKSQHLNIPNYQAGSHFAATQRLETNTNTLSIWLDRMPTDKEPDSPQAKATVLWKPQLATLQGSALGLRCPLELTSRCYRLRLCFRVRKGKLQGLQNRTEYLLSVARQGIMGRTGVTLHWLIRASLRSQQGRVWGVLASNGQNL